MRDYLIEPPEWDYSFTCAECGKFNELTFEGHKPYKVKLICEFCGADQDEYSYLPDEYDEYIDRLAEN